MICNDSITVIRAGTTTDRLNNVIIDWSSTTETLVERVSVQPAPAEQLEPAGFRRGREGDIRDVRINGWKLFSGRGVDLDLLATDRVRLTDGTVCEVIGEVQRWENAAGALHHCEARLERILG